MVRQWQQMYYESRYSETPISSPDYIKIADAYGLNGQRVTQFNEIYPAMQKAQHIKGPTLIEFVVEQNDIVYPMVSTGADLNDMVQRPISEHISNKQNEKEIIN